MRPSGMSGTRKLQDIFVDAKVPRRERRGVPLLFLDGECIWVVGVRRSAMAPAGPPPTGGALRVSFSPVPGGEGTESASGAGDHG